MKSRPIIFSGPMVRAILEGKKTQTRRVVKLPLAPNWEETTIGGKGVYLDKAMTIPAPEQVALWHTRTGACIGCFVDPGDLLWVRESGWEPKKYPSPLELRNGADTWPKYVYDADGISRADAEDFTAWDWKHRPSIFMPRWASRLMLEVVEVSVQQVQSITFMQAKAEGVNYEKGYTDPRGAFKLLWDSLNAKRGYGWDKNPWVWVIEFKRI